ncbi:hypothetical protein GN244_ATG04587 [Phytophthora infestans]|uniref:Uncharacterized protein n=1 Tax=Phytophthora infestans TaxID=4787 RepID=A0A833SY50_PHYIN|nr:hypothetical protein GN244_ATG04587 [Phytophthora infestans]
MHQPRGEIASVRIGEAHGSARGGWKQYVMFDIGEGYDVFRAKCIMKFNALAASGDVLKRKKQLQLRENSDIYLKRSSNENQDKYMRLSTTNFVESLGRRWQLLKSSDRSPGSGFRFLAFLYVKNATPIAASADFQRATEKRIQRARLQRLAHEATNAVTFGGITGHHLDIVNARRPDSAVFHVPDDNTTAQAMELDRQREALRTQRIQVEEQALAQTGITKLKWSGVWIPVEVDLVSLRRAIGLPDHDIFTSGIYHELTPTAPSQPNLEDFEHKEEEEHEEEDNEGEAMELSDLGLI